MRSSILDKAKELGGRNLKFRDFRDAFRLYGPNYGDVVRQVMRELESQGKVIITNIGKGNRNEYRYDII